MKTAMFASALAGLALVGCADDPTTIVELTVTETIPVDFGTMDAGVAESAAVALASLMQEPAYADNVDALRCGSIDVNASGLTVTQLQVGAGATVLTYTVEVAPAGTTSWTTLGVFTGSVTSGQRIALSDPSFVVDANGAALVSQIVLSESPALGVQVRAEVPGALDALQISLALALDFSSQASGCPTLAGE